MASVHVMLNNGLIHVYVYERSTLGGVFSTASIPFPFPFPFSILMMTCNAVNINSPLLFLPSHCPRNEIFCLMASVQS